MAQCIDDPSRITELFQISSVVKDMLQTEMKTGANHLNHNMFLVLRERERNGYIDAASEEELSHWIIKVF